MPALHAPHTATIVLVDDDPDVLNILARLLRLLSPDYALIAVNCGEAALWHLARCAVPLLITDYRLHGMTGLQLIQATKQISPHTRAVLISAYDTPALRRHIRAGQVDDYLVKPVLIEPIRQIVRATLG